MTDTIPNITDLDERSIQSQSEYDLFVYGTLCIPAVLVRVLGRNCNDLKFQDALLPGYTRHSVKGEDYPAIIDRESTDSILAETELRAEEYNVRGTLVSGLTEADIKALDVFEGSEYSRQKVIVHALSPASSVQDLPSSLTDPESREPVNTTQAEKVVKLQIGSSTNNGDKFGSRECWSYIWSDPLSKLEPKIWEFEDFMRDKAKYWVSTDTTEYDEVDKHRALETMPAVASTSEDGEVEEGGFEDGDEHKVVGKKLDGFPDFGRAMLSEFGFEDGYLNFNHGSYGSVPRVISAARQKILRQIEGNPDRFMRKDWLPLLNNVRAKTAELIGASVDECVIVPNTTHGINTIMQNIIWQPGDRIVIFSTTYGAVQQMMKFYCDMHPEIHLDIIDLVFSMTHDSIVDKTQQALSEWNEKATVNYTGHPTPTGKKPDGRVKMVVIDSIASNPGVVLPWERMVDVCQRYGVLSLVDGAHSIGQRKVDVGKSKCDFFVTNCHKWLYTPRSAAIMYVPLRNQHLVRSSFPVSAGYESTRYPTPGMDRKGDFSLQYEWNGTCDWSSFMTIANAIKWREEIGGEERIMEYCHTLAIEGGKRIAKKWGTRIMENSQGELTAAMVNVEVPIPAPKSLEERFQQGKYMEDKMFEKDIRWVPFVHDDKWWGRFSAQIWLELDDFDRVIDMTQDILQDIRDGKYLDVEPSKEDTLHRPEDVVVDDP